MKLSDFSIDRRIPVFVLIAAIFVMGIYSYATLPRESTPDIKVPLVTVAVPWPEASPEDVEKSITVPLERELRNVKGLKELSSVSSEGISITTCEFDPSVPVEEALQKVREKYDRAKAEFPADVEDETISELSFSEFPIMIVTLYGADVTVLEKLAEELEDKIEGIDGVLDVTIAGGVEPQIEIEVDPEKLQAYRLPVNQLIETLRGENNDISAGGVDTGLVKTSVRLPGAFKTAADVESLVIHQVDGRPVYLRDVARAYRSYKDPISYARRDGQPSVQLSISKRAGANIIVIAETIKYGMAQAKHDFPAGVEYAILTDASHDIRNMVTDLENNILSGLVLVLLVIFFALGFRNALFVATAIPLSLLISFSVLQLMGVTLNMVVLFALILAQGMLVDNAIVIIENIYRHIGMNKTPVQAAKDATAEVAWPVIASTATTLGAFGPMLFWPGIMGEFMSFLPLTVIVTLVSSLFVALVINPTIAATFMRFRKPTQKPINRKVEGFGNAALASYEQLLRMALRWPKVWLGAAFMFLVATVMLYGVMGHGVELFPKVEPKLAFVNITAAEGTSLQRTDELAKLVESRLPPGQGIVKGIETTVGGVGAGNPMEGGADATHLARITVSFLDQEDRTGSPMKWLEDLRPMLEDLPGADFEVKEQAVGPPTGAPINVEISVDDEQRLGEAVLKVRRIVESTPGVVDIRDNLRTGKPELRIRVDRQKAALLGLNTQWIGNFVKMLINGQRIGGYDERNEERDIIVRLPAESRNDPAVLDAIRVSDRFGNSIPLSTVCTWEYTGGPGTVRRKDGRRILTVSGNLAPGYQAEPLLAEIEKKISAEAATFPAGFKASFTGESEDKNEAQDFLSKAFVIALLLILLILVLQFNSLLQSGIILSSVVLSTVGVFISLIVLAQPFGIIMTGVAVIALAGVVVNNAIVMIDYINQLRRIHGRTLLDAIVEGGRTRLRPVMLTAITTALGLFPMALGVSFNFFEFRFVMGGESSEWWAPLATAMIFGLMIATVLTLVVVPCAYLVTARFGENASRFFRRVFGSPEDLAAEQSPQPAKPEVVPESDEVPVLEPTHSA
ncbi:MAG: efflux RND transporter permease subunit [Planctomycetes bacterium]|nr:efflux RND transporter permease subunit [Planctomycetota bacterium]MCW8134558.1 efflux RND transporter permease subunit [Planctomycetota bacterium]